MNRPNYISEAQWKQAQRHNPDPANMVPVPVLGFVELQLWIQNQDKEAGKYREWAQKLHEALNAMEATSQQMNVKVREHRQAQQRLRHRLVQVCSQWGAHGMMT